MAPLIDCEVDVQEPICAFRRRRAEAAAFQIPEPVEVCSSDEERPSFGRGRLVGSSDDSDDIGDEGERRILSKKERRQRRKELRSRRRSLSSDERPGNGGEGLSDGEGSASEIIDFIIDILTPDEEESLPAGDEVERNCSLVIPLSDREIRGLVREYRALCAESQRLTLLGEEDTTLDEWYANTELADLVEDEITSSSIYSFTQPRLV